MEKNIKFNAELFQERVHIKSVSTWVILSTLMLILAAITMWCVLGTVTDKAFATGVILPADGTIQISLPHEGTIRSVFVRQGDEVKKGETLAIVSSGDGYSVVKSTVNGTIFSIMQTNEPFEAFAPIINIVNENTNASKLLLMSFVTHDQMKDVHEDAPVQVWPSNCSKDEVGYVTGRVVTVYPYPVSESFLGDKRYNLSKYVEKQLSSNGEFLYEVDIDLDEYEDDRSKLHWSFENSVHHPEMRPGVSCNAIIITREMSILEFLFGKGRALVNAVVEDVHN